MAFHRLTIFALVLVSLVTSGTRRLQGEDLIGAKAVLRQVEESAENKAPADESNRWGKVVRELPDEMAKMDPKEAAATWLQTYDQWLTDEEGIQNGSGQSMLSEFVGALPPPAAWPELVRKIEARPIVGDEPAQLRALGLRMLGHRLLGQTDRLKQDLDQASKLAETRKKRGQGLAGLFGNMFGVAQPDPMDNWRQNAKERIQAVRLEFEPKSAFERFRDQLNRPEDELQGFLSVPDLVALAGNEQATPLLKKALLLTKTRLNFDSDRSGGAENATINLARELARKHVDELSQPHWELCNSIETLDLFEAFSELEKGRNPENPGMAFGSGSESVSPWYVVGLLLADRTDDAIKFLNQSHENGDVPSETVVGIQVPTPFGHQISSFDTSQILPSLEKSGRSQKVHAALVKALNEYPELPFWEMFVTLSAHLGQTRQVLSVVNTALDRTNLPESARRQLEQVRADALLAADRVPEGVAACLTLLDEPKLAAGGRWSSGQTPQQRALRVAEIGRLLQRDEWIQKGTDAAEKILFDDNNPAENEVNLGGSDQSDLTNFVGLLIDLKQWTRAEHLLGQLLARQVAQDLENERQAQGFRQPATANETLELLLQVYHTAGRSDHVLTLLEEAPWWNNRDVADWLEPDHNFSGHHGERTKLPVPYIVARALVQVGRNEEARKIAEAMVRVWPGFDPGWQLALELTGDDFEKLAEQTFAQDHFEERPLIWQARFHLDRDHLAQAEEIIRRAITIDPSDGEQGRDDRMRAYAILAEILRKKKDDKTAAVYEGAMKAIRLAEQADQFYAAGLLGRGIKMYSTSLTHFADAYCIQSRLAVQLAQSGDLEGAAKHYQRAFELMPDSFGRVESHCFGCEGVFDGPLAENIATRVFAKLVADQPKNPKVHYLLGYLRSSQSRYGEAVASFREATRLDPDYLNAWEKVIDTDDLQNVKLPIEVREEAVFQILRLDPPGRHAQPNLANVRDLARLWTVLHDRDRQVPKRPVSSLFSLKASRIQLDAERNARNVNSGFPMRVNGGGFEISEPLVERILRSGRIGAYHGGGPEFSEPQVPGVKFQSHDALRAIIELMQGEQANALPIPMAPMLIAPMAPAG